MEAIKASRYADNVAGNLLRLAHEICEVEADAGLQLHRSVSWTGRAEIYGGLLSLAPATLKLAPNKRSWLVDIVKLRLDDEGEVSLGVERDHHRDYPDDVFMRYYYDMASTMFHEHDHDDCRERFEASQPATTPLERLRDIRTGIAI
jgi:hypothetical protein